ncbi:ester cyclase [Kineococcus glutinatus]
MAEGDLRDFEAVVHPRAHNREAASEPPACRGTGPAALHASALWLRAAFADLRWEVHETAADGDLVVLRTTMSGRQTGTFVVHGADGRPERAFPATGRAFAVAQTHWFRLAGGLVVEHWADRDDLGQAAQLGWAPPGPRYAVRVLLATRRARRR